MNKEIEAKAKQLNQWILEQNVVKEFKTYELLLKNNPDLIQLETELKDMQKEIVNQKYHGKDCETLINSYQEKKKAFDENPIVYNYLILKEEVNTLLLEIQDDINQQLKKMVD